jgi:hypothetical protein
MANHSGMNQEFELPPERSSSDYPLPGSVEQTAARPENVGNEEAALPLQSGEQYAGIDQNLVQIKLEIERQLARQVGSSSAQALFAPQGASNVVGVGLGIPDDPASLGLKPGAMAVNVYVIEPTPVETVKAALVNEMGVSAASSDDVPINVITTGIIDAQPHRFCMRPAPGGISIGHYRITAGTLGCLAYRPGRLLVLSNNHVLANSNDGRFGDPLYQPGPYDGGPGNCSPNPVAILESFVPINFSGGVNYVDCATGWAWPDRVRKELVYLSNGKPAFFRINNMIRDPQVGMMVGKSGRTTQLTRGQIVDTNVTIRVNFGGGRVALFSDQIAVRGANGDFSAGGDSGSCIWTWDSNLNPVGLLFAGGGGYTFANKMGRVLTALGIQLYT